MTGYVGDGLSSSGNYRMEQATPWNPTGGVSTMPGDDKMHVVFYKKAVHNAKLSEEMGRPYYEDRDFVTIMQPGEMHTQVIREVKQTDKMRWPRQWAAFAGGKEQVANGTPIGLLFPNHPAQVATLQALGIMTVEHLSEASASAIDAIGGHGQDYVNYANQYLKRAASGSNFHILQGQLEEKDRAIKRLERQLEEMNIRMGMIAQQQAQPYVPQPVERYVAPPPPPVTFGAPPSFGPDDGNMLDVQQGNSNPGSEPAKRKGGWPAGKPRKPRAAPDSGPANAA